MDLEVEFVESAFRHGYEPEDFFEVLAGRPLKVRSRRGLTGVYEIYGCNLGGDYLHIAYRREPERTIVFHMRRMTAGERTTYRKLR